MNNWKEIIANIDYHGRTTFCRKVFDETWRANLTVGYPFSIFLH